MSRPPRKQNEQTQQIIGVMTFPYNHPPTINHHRIPYNFQPATVADVQIIGTHCMLEPMNPPLSTFPALQQAFAQQAIFSQAMV